MAQPAGFAEATFRFALAGGDGEANVVLGLDTPAANVDVANRIRSAWQSEILQPVQGNNVTYLGVRVAFGQDGGDDLVFEIPADGAIPVIGGQGAANMTPNNAILVRKLTGLGGRRNRGRMYIPGVPEGSYDNSGIILPGAKVQIQAALDAFVEDLGLAGLGGPSTIVILHPARPGYFRRDGTFYDGVPAAPPTPVTALLVDDRIASQRKRNR